MDNTHQLVLVDNTRQLVLVDNTRQLVLVGNIRHLLVGNIRLRRSAVDLGLLLRSVA